MNPKFFLSLCVLSLFGISCSGGEKTPFAEKCNQVCTLDPTHICADAKWIQKCNGDCRALAAQAALQSERPPEECGNCIADQFGYGVSSDGRTCYGVIAPTRVNIPECSTFCFEPDAGLH
ncbi:MAG: hypothetical protein V1754_15935 [Pseudomonadota bacterium]